MTRLRPSLWLSFLLPCVACGDDTTMVTESGTTTDATTTGTTTGTPTTGTPTTGTPTTGTQTDTDTTTTTTTTGESTTSTTTTTTTSSTSSTGDTTSTSSTSSTTTGAPCGPGEPGPDADNDTVPDACDLCIEGDDLADADNDTVPDACDACPQGDDLADADNDTVPDACDLCLAGDDGVDSDNDGVPDACDQCDGNDDGADMDADGLPDACDVCPNDPLDDSDDDGVCDGVDICLEGPNDIDADNDNIPDACDDEVLLAFPDPLGDHDVAGDGALVVVRATGGSVFVTCYNGDRSVRRPEFVAGNYDAGQQNLPLPEIHIARDTQEVLVTWFDRNGAPANHRIAYSLLDDQCQPIVSNQTGIAKPGAYFEFHNAAIDAVGNSVLSVTPKETLINFVDAAGVAGVQEQAFDINAAYGDHIAVNQATGDGILAAQVHSGNGIYYRRFNAGGGWLDPAPVQVPVNYHYWYDGFTVGMNDQGQFVFLWRSGGTTLDMRFFAADATVLADVQRTTIDFEGWDGGHCYDSFRRRHQEIPLHGDDFVLGEVYNWITPQQNRIVHHFRYTPAGQLVAEDSTLVNLDEGLTIRTDTLGVSYLRGPTGIAIVADYP